VVIFDLKTLRFKLSLEYYMGNFKTRKIQRELDDAGIWFDSQAKEFGKRKEDMSPRYTLVSRLFSTYLKRPLCIENYLIKTLLTTNHSNGPMLNRVLRHLAIEAVKYVQYQFLTHLFDRLLINTTTNTLR